MDCPSLEDEMAVSGFRSIRSQNPDGQPFNCVIRALSV